VEASEGCQTGGTNLWRDDLGLTNRVAPTIYESKHFQEIDVPACLEMMNL
jgi:hypothetical protein